MIKILDSFILWRMLIFVWAGSQINSLNLTLYLCSFGSTFVMVSLSFPIIIRVNALVPALYSKARPHGISVDSHLPTPSEFVKIKLQISSLLKQAAAEMSALCFLPFSCCFPLDSLESHPVDVQLGVIQGFEGISYADLGDFLSADASFLGILPQYPAALATLLYPLVSFFFFF